MSEAPPWARGFAVEELKALAAPFRESFKPHSYGAFGVPNERDVAEARAAGELLWARGPGGAIVAAAIARACRSGSTQRDFAQRPIEIRSGDVFVRHLAGSYDGMARVLGALSRRAGSAPLWVEIHEERPEARAVVDALGYAWVASKIAASSEIKGFYLRGAAGHERLPAGPLGTADAIALAQLAPAFALAADLDAVRQELGAFAEAWAQHYSSYNKRQSWTAFALKGFDAADPSFIIKPAEMSKAWKQDNAQRLSARCDWTPAAKLLPAALRLVERLPGEKERVRLMRLRAGDGELTRHADITDREAGTGDGQIARLHIPITTDPRCSFSSWTARGEPVRQHFAAGALCYLDIRKPHCVRNDSPIDRIHLVTDVRSGPALRALLAGAAAAPRG